MMLCKSEICTVAEIQFKTVFIFVTNFYPLLTDIHVVEVLVE